ncbi:SIMPL domain-containing protein [Mumia zhuanghuii]|uniref:SIMPL domain-containing protein n=2 Tax=Mumia TaxID=1546255 RepID=A0ABW1QSA0_9ACTN|nr:MULTISPECIES: SIMPL domain-containing protein [Mumia]KAA1424501.1 SIMPL domain-containing protein [Mumia zhuanghuii]
MPKITVAGQATQHLPAERGTLRLSVSYSGARREDVVAAAERTHATLVSGAKAQVSAGAATWWGADQVSAWTYDEWIKPSAQEEQVKVRRFRASAGVRVKFRDFRALSRWTSEVALLDGVSVGGVDWALTEVRRDAAVAEVRASAARDAVVRARAYADALGLGAVRLTTLYEDGLRPHVGGGVSVGGVAMRAAAAPSGGGGMELRPDDIEVSCAVTADFETLG